MQTRGKKKEQRNICKKSVLKVRCIACPNTSYKMDFVCFAVNAEILKNYSNRRSSISSSEIKTKYKDNGVTFGFPYRSPNQSISSIPTKRTEL